MSHILPKLWIAATVLEMLAGCGGTQTPIGHPGGSVSSLWSIQRHSAGGAFNARFSGRFTSACGQYGPSLWKFRGEGRASFLGASRERGYFKLVFSHACTIDSGEAILRSKSSGDKVRVSFSATQYALCSGSGAVPYQVHGGTGKFSGATGGGTVSFSCSGFSHKYTDSWAGALYY